MFRSSLGSAEYPTRILSGDEVIRASVRYEISPFQEGENLYTATVHFDSNTPDREHSILSIPFFSFVTGVTSNCQ